IWYSWHCSSENKTKDECIDSHQEHGVEQRPYKTERRAPITGCQVAPGQVFHQCRCLTPIAPDIRSPFDLVDRGKQLLSRGNCLLHSLSSTIVIPVLRHSATPHSDNTAEGLRLDGLPPSHVLGRAK